MNTITDTFIIQFAAADYHASVDSELVTEHTTTATGKSCAVCGSRLHMTSKSAFFFFNCVSY
jgi:hypothetical protein